MAQDMAMRQITPVFGADYLPRASNHRLERTLFATRRLGRNWLLGMANDEINALLAAASHNLRPSLKRHLATHDRNIQLAPGHLPASRRRIHVPGSESRHWRGHLG